METSRLDTSFSSSAKEGWYLPPFTNIISSNVGFNSIALSPTVIFFMSSFNDWTIFSILSKSNSIFSNLAKSNSIFSILVISKIAFLRAISAVLFCSSSSTRLVISLKSSGTVFCWSTTINVKLYFGLAVFVSTISLIYSKLFSSTISARLSFINKNTGTFLIPCGYSSSKVVNRFPIPTSTLLFWRFIVVPFS